MPAPVPAIARPPDRVGPWALAGLALYLVWAFLSVFVVIVVERVVLALFGLGADAGSASLSLRNGFQPVVWGLGVVAVALPAARRFVPGVRFGTGGWALLAAGLVLAGVTEFLVDEFVRARFGLYMPRATGWSIFAAPAVVAVSLAAWAGLATPGARARVIVILMAAAVAGLALALLPSLPGASDGIAPASLPLATVCVIDAAYAVGALVLVIRRSVARDANRTG